MAVVGAGLGPPTGKEGKGLKNLEFGIWKLEVGSWKLVVGATTSRPLYEGLL